jgi:hypothetical protein
MWSHRETRKDTDLECPRTHTAGDFQCPGWSPLPEAALHVAPARRTRPFAAPRVPRATRAQVPAK